MRRPASILPARCAARLRPPADKSISHRAALIAAMGEGETAIEGYLDAADTRSTLAAVEALGARVEGAGDGGVAADASRSAASACGARRRPSIDVGNAGTLLRLLPGWLAGQAGGSLDARRRRVDPAPPGRPDRRAAAADGRAADLPRGSPAAAANRGRAAARHLLRAAGRQRSGQVLRAVRRAARRGRDARWSSRCRAATTRERMLRGRGRGGRARRRLGRGRSRPSALEPGRDRRPGRLLLRRVLRRRRRCLCAAARCGSPGSGSTRPGPGCSRSSSGWGPRSRSSRGASAGGEPIGDRPSSRPSELRGDRGRRRRGAAGDRRAAAGGARRLLRRGRRRRSATRPSCGARSPTGSPP